jgi:Fis family transcriptional regulator
VTKDNIPANERRKKPLSSCVKHSLDRYFRDLDGHKPGNLYDMVIGEVEQPLLEAVLRHTQGNQSRAAEVLGINRATLRKKLEFYGIV